MSKCGFDIVRQAHYDIQHDNQLFLISIAQWVMLYNLQIIKSKQMQDNIYLLLTEKMLNVC